MKIETSDKTLFASRQDLNWLWAAVVLFLLLGVLILCTFRDYGISWDEPLQKAYGDALLAYYRPGMRDPAFLKLGDAFFYGGSYEIIVAWLTQHTALPWYDTRHLLNALTGLAGIIGVWRLARQWTRSYRAGFFAALFLATAPVWYGQQFFNSRDIPLATATVWAFYVLCRIHKKLPRPPFPLVSLLGFLIGVIIGIRIPGLIIFIPVILSCLSHLHTEHRKKTPESSIVRNCISLVVFYIGPVVAVSYAILILSWPWIQEQPLTGPYLALVYFHHISDAPKILLAGQLVAPDQAPWFYLALYFMLQTPLLFLTSFCAAPFVLKERLWRDYTGVALLGYILLPFVLVPAGQVGVYDNGRHILYVLPLMAVLAGAALHRCVDFSGVRFLSLLAPLALLATVPAMIDLHPYEYTYFNALAGGLKGADNRFDTDYWGLAFRAAAEKFTLYLKAADPNLTKRYTVAVCGPPASASAFWPDRAITISGAQNSSADFFFATTRWHCDRRLEGKEIVRIERDGVPFAIVKDLRSAR